jgi:hypothetical protein
MFGFEAERFLHVNHGDAGFAPARGVAGAQPDEIAERTDEFRAGGYERAGCVVEVDERVEDLVERAFVLAQFVFGFVLPRVKDRWPEPDRSEELLHGLCVLPERGPTLVIIEQDGLSQAERLLDPGLEVARAFLFGFVRVPLGRDQTLTDVQPVAAAFDDAGPAGREVDCGRGLLRFGVAGVTPESPGRRRRSGNQGEDRKAAVASRS